MVLNFHLAMFSSHVSHICLSGTKDSVAFPTCVSSAWCALQLHWAVTVIFLQWQRRLLVKSVETIFISTVFVAVVGGTAAAGAVRFCQLGA